MGGLDAAALVADAQGERGGLGGEAWEARWWRDCDEHGWERMLRLGLGRSLRGVGVVVDAVVVVLFTVVLDGRAEGVLEDLGQDVFHVDWNITGVFVGCGLG